MTKLKTHKATKKRIRLTKNKKMMQRTAGQDHFNAREGSKIMRNKRSDHQVAKANRKQLKELLPYE